MTIELKDLEKIEEKVVDGLIHVIANDTVKNNIPIKDVVVETIAKLANGTVPATDRTQKLPSARDFKKHIAGKTLNQNNS